MRLIDADKYPCKDCGSMDDWCRHTCGTLKTWLNTTTYDVDKVIDELEGCVFRVDFNDGDDCMAVELDEVIDIVKRGGIDD